MLSYEAELCDTLQIVREPPEVRSRPQTFGRGSGPTMQLVALNRTPIVPLQKVESGQAQSQGPWGR